MRWLLPTGEVEPRRGVELRVVNGVPSTAEQDAVVMLVRAGTSDRHGICTGVMIAPRLVLTARHCVSDSDQDVGCDADGTPLVGARVRSDHAAQDLHVFTGAARADFTNLAPSTVDTTRWQPAARGVQILHDGATTLCNHDLALLVIDTPLTTPLAALRLTREPKVGEPSIAVGWGLVSAMGEEPSVRQQRRDVVVRRLGPDGRHPVLAPSEFLTGEAICSGDSGGPVFSQETNAVIGVVSRGGNGEDHDPARPGATCVNADNFNTKLSPFRDLFDRGFAAVGASAILEPEPSDDGGCAVAARRAEPGVAAAMLLLLALARRCRKSNARA